MLSGQINPESLSPTNQANNNAGVAEPGQMRKSAISVERKVEGLVP
jgi:hypothetical protein